MKVAIATPCYSGRVSVSYTDSLLGTLAFAPANAQPVWVKHVGCPYLALAYSIVAARAMAHGADKIFFVDDDIGWQPEDFWRIAGMDMPLVTGVYPLHPRYIELDKTLASQAIMSIRMDDDGSVFGAGLGFVCVSREVFETLKGSVRKFRRGGLTEAENEELYDYFSPADEHDVWCGEDFSFCMRAKAAGYSIELDLSARLTHHAGRVAFANK